MIIKPFLKPSVRDYIIPTVDQEHSQVDSSNNRIDTASYFGYDMTKDLLLYYNETLVRLCGGIVFDTRVIRQMLYQLVVESMAR